jgi:hypothetical protein
MIVPDVVGGLHKVKWKKVGTELRIVVEKIRGPRGCRHPDDSGMSGDLLYAVCRSRYEWEASTATTKAMLYHPARKGAIDDTARSQILDHVMKFEELFRNKINVVMGPARNMEHHVRRWAVLEYFRQVTWNRALSRGNHRLLWRHFDVRWTSEFEPLLHLHDGQPRVDMHVAMKFLFYGCTTPACLTKGFCAEMCAYCKKGVERITSSRTGASYTSDQIEQAYQAWKSKRRDGTDSSMKAFKATNSKYKSGGGGAKISNPTATQVIAYMGTHEQEVVPPAPMGSR